jgi:hypothetical protein
VRSASGPFAKRRVGQWRTRPRETADGDLTLPPASCGMRHDPNNLDHVAYSIVGLGIFGWIISLLLR